MLKIYSQFNVLRERKPYFLNTGSWNRIYVFFNKVRKMGQVFLFLSVQLSTCI